VASNKFQEKKGKQMKQETTLELQQQDEKLQKLDGLLQQLEVQTFEVEDIAHIDLIAAASTCSSTTSSCCKGATK